MKRKLFLMFTLLCAAAQGAWAQVTFPIVYDDVWDGTTKTKPTFHASYGGKSNVYVINTAAELVYVNSQWDEPCGDVDGKDFYEVNYYLNANLDMNWNKCWTPLGGYSGQKAKFDGEFYGNGHTIRIHIFDTNENYQGLFAHIDYGKVENLHVTGKIECKKSRLVGGIVGQNWNGTIQNCWVSADVSSEWHESGSSYTAKVGGIAGQCGEYNQINHIKYCCVSGNVTNNDADVGGIVGCCMQDNNSSYVEHVTFYGTRNSTHSQKNVYFGDNGGYSVIYLYLNDSFQQSELDAAGDNNMYRQAVMYPFAVNINTVGSGSVKASVRKDQWHVVNDITRWHPGETVTLTKTSGTLASISSSSGDSPNDNGGGVSELPAVSNDFTGNSLQGVGDPAGLTAADPSTTYVLNKKSSGIGFYKLKAGKTAGVGKAYLTYSGGGAMAREFFGFSETTSVDDVRSTKEDAPGDVFDLQGRRVSQPTKGLYIVRSAAGRSQGKNGKKVFINK